MGEQRRQHWTRQSCLGPEQTAHLWGGRRASWTSRVYETSSMSGEVMPTAHTFLPSAWAVTAPASLHVSFIFQLPSCNGLFQAMPQWRVGFWGCLLHFHVQSSGLGVLFWFSLFLAPSPEFIPWQRASGSAGPLTVLPCSCLSEPNERHLISFLADAGWGCCGQALNC